MTNASKSLNDLRGSMRYPTNIEAVATAGGAVYPVVIANISTGGALIKGLPILPVGCRVLVQAASLDVAATVVQGTVRGIGVHFSKEVNPLAVVRQNVAGLEHLRKPERDKTIVTLAALRAKRS